MPEFFAARARFDNDEGLYAYSVLRLPRFGTVRLRRVVRLGYATFPSRILPSDCIWVVFAVIAAPLDYSLPYGMSGRLRLLSLTQRSDNSLMCKHFKTLAPES